MKSLHTTFQLFLLSLVVLLCVSCSKKNALDPTDQSSDSDVKINPNAKLIPATVVSALISQDSTTLTLQSNDSFGQTIHVNDILVADTSRVFPYGVLRKVVQVKTAGGRLVILTVNSSLNELILSGTIHYEKSYSSGGRPVADGEIVQPINWTFYDADKNPATKNDQVSLTGEAKLKPKFIFDWVKEEGSLYPREVKIGYERVNTFTAKIWASVGNIPFEKPLLELPLPTIKFTIRGFPVIFTSQLLLSAGFTITGPLKAELGIAANYTSSSLMHYKDGTWNYESSQSPVQYTPILPQIDNKGVNVKVSFPKITTALHPYGLKNITLGLSEEQGIKLGINCPKLTLSGYFGNEAAADANFTELISGLKTSLKYPFNQSPDIPITTLDNVDICKESSANPTGTLTIKNYATYALQTANSAATTSSYYLFQLKINDPTKYSYLKFYFLSTTDKKYFFSQSLGDSTSVFHTSGTPAEPTLNPDFSMGYWYDIRAANASIQLPASLLNAPNGYQKGSYYLIIAGNYSAGNSVNGKYKFSVPVTTVKLDFPTPAPTPAETTTIAF